MSHATKLGLAIAAIVGTVSVAQAGGHMQEKGITVSGHVNQMVRINDDSNSDETDTQIVDNGTNASRVSIGANGEFAGMDVSVFSQFRWNANNSALVEPGDDNSGESDLQTAYLDIAFAHELGTFSIGRGDGAARYTQRQDLSRTELADNFDLRRWYASSGDDEFMATNVGFEGTRKDRVRYDAPSFMGTNFSISADGDGTVEAGLTWDSQAEEYSEYMDGLRWIGAIGLSNVKDDDDSFGVDDRIAASISALLDGGFNVTVGIGEESYEGSTPDSDGTYIKVGQQFGNHAVSLSLTNLEQGSSEDDITSIGYQYSGEGGVDVYAGYSQWDPEFGDDEDQFIIGSRVRF